MQIEQEIGGRKVIFVWHDKKILPNVPIWQVYGFNLTPDKKVVLVRDKGETRFTLPGGRVDGSEGGEEACKREFIEEAQVIPNKMEILGVMEVIDEGGKTSIEKHHLQARYICHLPKLGEFIPGKDGFEIEERIEIPPEDLPKYINWIKYPTGKIQFDKFMETIKK